MIVYVCEWAGPFCVCFLCVSDLREANLGIIGGFKKSAIKCPGAPAELLCEYILCSFGMYRESAGGTAKSQ
jgi:hypothetical protein